LCCLFFDLWIMITPLVSSNYFYIFKANTLSNTSVSPSCSFNRIYHVSFCVKFVVKLNTTLILNISSFLF
jgi:hypothetical protein